MWSQINESLYPLLINGLLLTLSTAIPLGFKWLRDWLVSKIKNERGILAIDTIDRVVRGVVAASEQTLKAKYEEAKADGKVTPEELREMAELLKGTAVSEVKKTLGEEIPGLLKELASGFDFENYVSTRIEAEVLDLKRSPR